MPHPFHGGESSMEATSGTQGVDEGLYQLDN
jgi:hypothetical protein